MGTEAQPDSGVVVMTCFLNMLDIVVREMIYKVRMGPHGQATAQAAADVTGFNISAINWHRAVGSISEA